MMVTVSFPATNTFGFDWQHLRELKGKILRGCMSWPTLQQLMTVKQTHHPSLARWAEPEAENFLCSPPLPAVPPPPPECVIADSTGMAAPPGGAGIVWQTPANPPESHDYIIRNGK